MRFALRNRCFLLAVLVHLNGSLAVSQSQGQGQISVGCDQYGNPLPEGAIARLGTLRLVHLGNLTSVAVSPDAKIVASGVAKGKEIYLGEKIVHQAGGFSVGEGVRVTLATIRLWDSDNGKLIREIGTPDAPVSSVYFAPKGNSLFAGCGKFLCCWDFSTGKKLWEQEAIKGAVFDYGVHAEKILSAKDKLISLHGGKLYCPVNKNGGFALFNHGQKVVRFWDSKTGKPLPLPKVLDSTVQAETRIPTLFHDLAVSANGAFAAVLVSQAEPGPTFEAKWKYTNRRLEIIEISTGKIVHTVPDQDATLQGLTFSEDGNTLALLAGKEIWLIKTATGQKKVLANVLSKPAPAKDVSSWMSSKILQLMFIDGKQLAAQMGNDSIRVWDIATGKSLDKHAVHKRFFATAKSGQVAASIHGNTVRLVDFDSGKAMHSFAGHRLTPIIRYALHAKDTVVSRDGEQGYLWDTGSWKTKDSVVIPGEDSKYWWYYTHHGDMDRGVSVEKQRYVKDVGKCLELWNLKNHQLVRALEESAGEWRSAYFSPAGNRLVVHQDKLFHFYDVATGKHLSKLPRKTVHWLGFNCPEVFFPQGDFFALNPDHVRIDIFDVNSGKISRSLVPAFHDKKKKMGSILGFNVSADAQIVLAEVHELAGGKNLENVGITLWDIKSGKIIQDIVLWPEVYVFWRKSLNAPLIQLLAMSNDHRLFAVTELDGKTIQIWETASGTKRGELIGHNGPIADLAFSPDSRQLASSSEDTTILIWDMNRPLQPGNFKKHLDAKELTALWQTLFESDAKKADTAIWSLVHAAKDSVPFIKKHLLPAKSPQKKQVQDLLDALDSGDFKVRTKAQSDLEGFGELVLNELEAALKQDNSAEKQVRLKELLQKAQKTAQPFGTSKNAGEWRALEVLERIGSLDAKKLLRELADGTPGARLTIAAQSALTRLETPAKPKQ